MEIELYLVGKDKDDAQGTFPFSDIDEAHKYQFANVGTFIWTVTAVLKFETMELW